MGRGQRRRLISAEEEGKIRPRHKWSNAVGAGLLTIQGRQNFVCLTKNLIPMLLSTFSIRQPAFEKQPSQIPEVISDKLPMWEGLYHY